MGSLTTTSSAIGAVSRELAAFLKANMANLQSAQEGWPAPNEKLVYPAVTVFPKTPAFTPLMPYVIARGNPDPITHLAIIRRVVGMYDLELQLDLWTEYKPQRDSLVQDLLLAFNKRDVPGVDLTLATYYSQTCHLSIDKIQYIDDEAGVQRGEWRAIVTVLCNVRLVAEQTGYLMEEIDNNLQIPESIGAVVDTDDVPLL